MDKDTFHDELAVLEKRSHRYNVGWYVSLDQVHTTSICQVCGAAVPREAEKLHDSFHRDVISGIMDAAGSGG